jgi:large subunit ribosomal protein L23
MAIFGSKKEEKKGTATKPASYARAHGLLEGKAHEIIRAPWFSEKALLSTDKGVYVFAVPMEATKESIAGAIKEIYNVKPKKIHIVNLPAKKVAMRKRRGEGTRARRRKAYVYLNAGDTIALA